MYTILFFSFRINFYICQVGEEDISSAEVQLKSAKSWWTMQEANQEIGLLFLY